MGGGLAVELIVLNQEVSKSEAKITVESLRNRHDLGQISVTSKH